jgi:hypothetical protein
MTYVVHPVYVKFGILHTCGTLAWTHHLTKREISGADPGFQVGGDALKKIAPSGGRRENVWGISCEKLRFYAKKSYFFQFLDQ